MLYFAPFAPVAQLDRVPGYEPGGRGFKSCRARQTNERVAAMQPVLISGRVAHLLDKYDHRGVEKLLGMVLDGQLLVADLDARDVEDMRRLTAKYDGMDLVDASLVSVGDQSI